MRHFILSALFLLFTIPSALAQDQDMDSGLYDPLPSSDAAFIRFINTTDEKQSPASDGKEWPSVKPKEVSPYYVLGSGQTQLSLGVAKTDFTPEPGKYYTAAAGTSLTVLEDKREEDRSKALIQFYNLSYYDALSLKTGDGKIEIIAPVPTGATGSRALNAVKIQPAIYDKHEKFKDLADVSLERGLAYTLVIFEDNTIIWMQSTTDTTR